jgi:hypothetical protein
MSDGESEHSRTSFTKKLGEIEIEINRADLSKREKRLLQNRKSALKCRLKKQDFVERIRGQLDKSASENVGLKEEIAALKAVIGCKKSEFDNLNNKFNELQMQ